MQENQLKRLIEEKHKAMIDEKKPDKRLTGLIQTCLETMHSLYNRDTQAEDYARVVAVLGTAKQLNVVVQKLLGKNYADGEALLKLKHKCFLFNDFVPRLWFERKPLLAFTGYRLYST